MAFHKKLEGLALQARNDAIKVMLERASVELNVPKENLVVRPLRPTDLGNLGGTWETVEIGTTLSELHNLSVGDNRWLSIYGLYMQPSIYNTSVGSLLSAGTGPFITAQITNNEEIHRLQISRKGSVVREWTINPIPFWESHTGYVDDPIIVDQNTNITTSFVASGASTLDGRAYALLGDVVERRGLVINP